MRVDGVNCLTRDEFIQITEQSESFIYEDLPWPDSNYYKDLVEFQRSFTDLIKVE